MKTKNNESKTLGLLSVVILSMMPFLSFNLSAVTLPGPDNTICTFMAGHCRDERGLVDTCRGYGVEGCVGNSCTVYFDIPHGSKVCFSCFRVTGQYGPIEPSSCYCSGIPFTVSSSTGYCDNDLGPCFCRYNENEQEDVQFYSCTTSGGMC